VDRGAACGILTAPLDPSLIEALVCRERRIVEFRQRARNASARTREREERLRSFAAIVRATGRELDPHRIIDLAMGEVHRFLKPRAWLFLLVDPDVGLLTIEKTVGEGLGGQAGRKIGVGEGVAGRAAQRRRTVLVEEIDLRGANAIAPELPTDLEPRSVIAVPLLSRGRVIGVVEVVDMQARHQLRASDARLLALLLEPAAVAIDNALLLRKSEELSITDDLTRLHNSRFLNTTLRREVERSKRYRTSVSLIFLDLDGFKKVNDQHGHLFGSRTLVEVGAVIKETVRTIDVVCRFGGDEFTVILPQTGPEGAFTIADRIRQRIAETVFLQSCRLAVRLTASLGIASFPDHGRTKDDLLARADQAMYSVKGQGKNGVALALTESPRPIRLPVVR
jgi:diguanylate cyclase (GGDEF)-like protein